MLPWAMIVATVASSSVLWNHFVSAGTEDLPAQSRSAAAGATD